MKDMYNNWRSDVHEWMNESTLNRYDDLKKAGIHNQNTIKFTLAAHAWRYMLGGMRLTASMVHMIETPAFQGFQLNELLGTDSLMTRNSGTTKSV